MKKGNIILAAIGAALLLLRRIPAAGIGKVRRNIFREISWLQEHDVPLGRDYNHLDWSQQNDVARMCTYAKYRQSEASKRNGESLAESYYKSISRQYLKLVNPAIGKINYPHTTSTVRNSRGDVVLTYNDYDPERDLSDALDWYVDQHTTYTNTVYAIARGQKFAWNSKKTAAGARLLTGVKDAIYGGENHPAEKKELRQILSPNGQYIEIFAETYGTDNGSMDDYNAVCEAIRDFHSPKAAKEYILDQYYKTFDDGRPEYDPNEEDLPF